MQKVPCPWRRKMQELVEDRREDTEPSPHPVTLRFSRNMPGILLGTEFFPQLSRC